MARPSRHDGVLYNEATARSGGCATGTKMGAAAWNQRRPRTGRKHSGRLRERLQARDENTLQIVRKGEQLLFDEWADFFLENYSKPPIRAAKTHRANESALKAPQTRVRDREDDRNRRDQIEIHLRRRLQQRRRVRRKAGIIELGTLKPATVHQEFRVLRRIFSVAVKKKLCPANPCAGVEFPVVSQKPVPATLHEMVGTADDRASRSYISA